jgi:hypothetical protein
VDRKAKEPPAAADPTVFRRWEVVQMSGVFAGAIDWIGPYTQATPRTVLSFDDLARLVRRHGPGRWKKRKGTATIRLADGSIHHAEVHCYEAAGIGRREVKIKRYLNATS